MAATGSNSAKVLNFLHATVKIFKFDLSLMFKCAYIFVNTCLLSFLTFAYPYENQFIRCLFGGAQICFMIYVRCFFNFRYYYWGSRGIPGPKPNLFFRNEDYKTRYMFEPDKIKEIYDKYPDEPAVGIFAQCQPMLFLRDLSLIEDVLVKNFGKFPYRGLETNPHVDPVAESLFHVKDPKWRPLRRKLSPVFTSAKIKLMFDSMKRCIDDFIEVLNDAAKEGEPVEFCELTGLLTTDSMALCLFGIDSKTLQDEDSEFHRLTPDAPVDDETEEKRSTIQIIKKVIKNYLTTVKGLLELDQSQDDAQESFFEKVVKDSMEERKKNGIKKNDFLDLLIHLKDHPEQLERERVSDDMLLVQAQLFFQSGQEPASLTISHALYELALNQDIQNKLRNEIIEIVTKNGGELDYESVCSAKYLDKVVKETFRKYPPTVHLARKVVHEHTFPNTHITVPKKRIVVIPVYAIHHDPKVYPEPKKFDPERFDQKVAKSRPRMSYLPFGDGPRNCIAQRFIQYQIKLCLAAVITNFKFKTCEETFKVYKQAVSYDFLAPDGGLYLSVTNYVKKKKYLFHHRMMK